MFAKSKLILMSKVLTWQSNPGHFEVRIDIEKSGNRSIKFRFRFQKKRTFLAILNNCFASKHLLCFFIRFVNIKVPYTLFIVKSCRGKANPNRSAGHDSIKSLHIEISPYEFPFNEMRERSPRNSHTERNLSLIMGLDLRRFYVKRSYFMSNIFISFCGRSITTDRRVFCCFRFPIPAEATRVI